MIKALRYHWGLCLVIAIQLLSSFYATAQNPATIFEIPTRDIGIPCGTNCVTVAATVPHIKQTNEYVTTTPAYLPFSYSTTTGTVISSIYVDDTWSQPIPIGFNFCYYGNTFLSILVGSNSGFTFDISRAGSGSGYSISTTTGAIPNTSYAPNMIFGPYHDINPAITSANRRIEWRVEGTAPTRRFIASFNDVLYFGTSCTTQRATHQMVLYESTGIVEVYIKDKPVCTLWNSGNAILGMQDGTRTRAVAAPGKNASQWGTTGMNECYRFIPSSGTPQFRSAKLILNGNIVSSTPDTSTVAPGKLSISFPNVCPTTSSALYHLEVTYADCLNPGNLVTFRDSVTLTRLPSTLLATPAVTPPACGASDGSISVNAVSGGTTPYQYSINGGALWQGSNVFSGLAAGTYTISVRDASGVCTATLPVTVNSSSTLSTTVSAPVPSACAGVNNGSFTISAAAGSGLYSFTLDGVAMGQGTIPRTFTNLSPANHVLVVTNVATGCSSGNLTINVPSGPGILATTTTTAAASSCPGVSNGSIAVNVLGGTAPFTYQLSGGVQLPLSNPGVISNLAPSTSHTVVIRDNFGCALTRTVFVPAGPPLLAGASPTATTCDGAVNGNLVVTPLSGTAPFTFSLDGGSFVSGAAPFTFNNLAAGPHQVIVRDAQGCQSNAVPATVVAGPPLVTTATSTPALCNAGSTGNITVAPPTIGQAPYQYSLDGIGWQTSNQFTGLMAGTYTIRFRETNGCVGSTSIDITEPSAITLSATTVPVVCNGQSNGQLTVISSGGMAPYQYSVDGGANWQTSNGFSLSAGTYTLSIKDANNCTRILPVVMSQPPVLAGTVSTSNASCNGGNDGALSLTPTGGNGNYSYSLDGGINWQTSNSFNLAPGSYTVTVKDQLNCTLALPAVVGLTNDLTLSPQNDVTICESKSTQLQIVSNALQYDWTPASGLSAVNIANPVASPRVTTQYIVALTMGRCVSRDTVLVTVNPAPIPDAGSDIFICYGQTATLNGRGGTVYRWTPSTYLNNPNLANAVSTPDRNIYYVLSILSDANGCAALVTDTVAIDVTPPIQIKTFPADTIGYPGDQFQLLAVPNDPDATLYVWTPSVGLSNAGVASPTVTVGAIGNDIRYKVVASTVAGCRGEGYVNVRVYKGPDIYVPTGFTPNGDGKNDKFTPFPVGMKSYNYFRIFNRWGQVVFQTRALNEGWDGTIGGQLQPEGIYVWMIEGLTKDDRVITKKGTIMLIK
ncbi:MAG: gliding motility-associated C-terminal domain-containing protein [Sphingomonadales bacterium]